MLFTHKIIRKIESDIICWNHFEYDVTKDDPMYV